MSRVSIRTPIGSGLPDEDIEADSVVIIGVNKTPDGKPKSMTIHFNGVFTNRDLVVIAQLILERVQIAIRNTVPKFDVLNSMENMMRPLKKVLENTTLSGPPN